ncbi:TBC1 domain family member 10A isoform X2 [Latimeria chalumnae]|uniref:TBC1 domain family member 10A isoform X2 n=1 Tax=Latimeria chalumnae TaxID=7897 RepID=UPI00313C62D8
MDKNQENGLNDSVSLRGTRETLTETEALARGEVSSLGSDSEINGFLGERKIDKYGFIGGAQYTDEGQGEIPPEILRQRESKWLDMLNNWDKWMAKKHKKIKLRCQKGIPPALRGRAWQYLSGSKVKLEQNSGKFDEAIQLDGEILFSLLRKVSPVAYKHLSKHKIDPILYMTEWFMCAFSRTLPWASVLRVWDMFFCEGVKIIFRVGLVLLKYMLGSPDKLKSCQGQYETMEKLRTIDLRYMQEGFLVREIIELPVTEREIEREHLLQLKKWKDKHGDLQCKSPPRLHGAKAIIDSELPPSKGALKPTPSIVLPPTAEGPGSKKKTKEQKQAEKSQEKQRLKQQKEQEKEKKKQEKKQAKDKNSQAANGSTKQEKGSKLSSAQYAQVGHSAEESEPIASIPANSQWKQSALSLSSEESEEDTYL